MKLKDIDAATFQSLDPEIQKQLIEAANQNEIVLAVFGVIAIITMFIFVYFFTKEIK